MKHEPSRQSSALPVAMRLELVSEDLNELAEHVNTLRDTVSKLIDDKQPRGAAILDSAAVEEAGKAAFVHLDFAGADTTRQPLHLMALSKALRSQLPRPVV